MLKIIQIGLGPLGQKVAGYVSEREGAEIVGAVDINPEWHGKKLSELTSLPAHDVVIRGSVEEANEAAKADAVILTTVSTMAVIADQIEEIVALGLPVVSTCEELLHPWNTAPKLARQIDDQARQAGVAVLGTGVNPGFLMDTLPALMTAACQRIDRIEVVRKQDASHRRIPFQKKIGAGLDMASFEALVAEKKIRHVGLTESVHLLAEAAGWKLDEVEDVITPVIASEPIETEMMRIPAGGVAGVNQVGIGRLDGEEKVNLWFRASVGEPEPEDSIRICGQPNLKTSIEGGLHGDVATCAIAVNAVKQIVKAPPGLRTMADMPLVSFLR